MIKKETKVKDLSLTTNGVYLEEKADSLADAGLDRINISLDSLDPNIFKRLTRRDNLQEVLRGIEESKRVGLKPIKLNTVLVKGLNTKEIDKLIKFSIRNNLILRFIGLMPMGIVKQTGLKGLSREQVKDRLRADGYNVSDTQKPLGQGPAKYIQVSKGDIEGKIGLIFPFEKNFCVNCNKIRITFYRLFYHSLRVLQHFLLHFPIGSLSEYPLIQEP